jgi:hypothetical protein
MRSRNSRRWGRPRAGAREYCQPFDVVGDAVDRARVRREDGQAERAKLRELRGGRKAR